MDDATVILVCSDNPRIAEIARLCDKSLKDITIALVDLADAVRVPFDEVVIATQQAVTPVRDLSDTIEELNMLMERTAVEQGETVHSYGKFLPKPIGRQRR